MELQLGHPLVQVLLRLSQEKVLSIVPCDYSEEGMGVQVILKIQQIIFSLMLPNTYIAHLMTITMNNYIISCQCLN